VDEAEGVEEKETRTPSRAEARSRSTAEHCHGETNTFFTSETNFRNRFGVTNTSHFSCSPSFERARGLR